MYYLNTNQIFNKWTGGMRKHFDHYSKKAKDENYPARSVYKLREIQNKYRIIKPGFRVLDVGCCPGSWSKLALKELKASVVIGLDIENQLKINHPNFAFIKRDVYQITENELLNKLKSILLERTKTIPEDSQRKLIQFDVVISDAAPKTTGDPFSDSQKLLELTRRVFELSDKLLKKKGSVVAKVFQCEDLKPFTQELKSRYEEIHLFKPHSSRKESREIYIIALRKIS